ncbi:MAG: ABC transporter ATP-binding protein, partial [archaeon]|nr:ABC transporter ATP-binding protein [archaeon]
LKELAHIIGYVPVASNDYNVMTVLDTVMVGRYARQKWKADADDILVAHRALETMEVEDLSMRYFNELSAGQHQKVAIARGLVQEPKILILDEPTSNLDIRHQIYVSAFLSKLSECTGTTVIMISHDLNLAARFADRVIVMERPGRIHSIGTPKEVFTEKMIQDVYNVGCKIVDDDGSPHVILKNVF